MSERFFDASSLSLAERQHRPMMLPNDWTQQAHSRRPLEREYTPSSYQEQRIQPGIDSVAARRVRGLALLKRKYRPPRQTLAKTNFLNYDSPRGINSKNINRRVNERRYESIGQCVKKCVGENENEQHNFTAYARNLDHITEGVQGQEITDKIKTIRCGEVNVRNSLKCKQSFSAVRPKAEPESKALMDEFASVPIALKQCEMCGRQFSLESYAKHRKICRRVFQTTRKKFDMSAHRLAGTDFQSVKQRGKPRNTRRPKSEPDKSLKPSAPTVPKWKIQSEQFRSMLRAARQPARKPSQAAKCNRGGGQKKLRAAAEATVSIIDPLLVACPHCSRRFNDKVAERHIPVCATIRHKPRQLHRGQGRGAHMRREAPPVHVVKRRSKKGSQYLP